MLPGQTLGMMIQRGIAQTAESERRGGQDLTYHCPYGSSKLARAMMSESTALSAMLTFSSRRAIEYPGVQSCYSPVLLLLFVVKELGLE